MSGQPGVDASLLTSLVMLGRLFVALDSAFDTPGVVQGSAAAPGLPGVLTLVALGSGPSRPREIGQITGLTSAGVTQLLDRLERDGFTVRTHGDAPEDRRAVVVRLTDSGRDALGALDAVLVARSPAFVASLTELLEGSVAGGGTTAAIGAPDVDAPSPPLLPTFLGLVAGLDAAVLRVTGDGALPLPPDPRPVVLLFELLRAGELRLAEIPGLVDRSRGAVHRLLRRMEAAGHTVRVATRSGGRAITVVRLTPGGTAVARALVDSFAADAAVAPLARAFVAAVTARAAST